MFTVGIYALSIKNILSFFFVLTCRVSYNPRIDFFLTNKKLNQQNIFKNLLEFENSRIDLHTWTEPIDD